MSPTCHACGYDAVEPFFRMERIPLSSCVLPETEQAAAEFGRGDLELAVCPRCGFIQNHLFRPELVDYTMPYEESQAFSPRFVAFQKELVYDLVEKYDPAGKTIFEIGCGKGSFLETICAAAGARGIGIDPTAEPSRLAETTDITLLREFFDETKTHLTGDLICCRHTLEHVQPVSEFVGNVAASAANTPDSIVFFELPDTDRILDEGAFWDVYYEHCSYFTIPSLSWLFRSHGFEVLRLERAFDDQYLLLDARTGTVDKTFDEPAVKDIVERCHAFGATARAEVERWRRLIREYTDNGQTVVVWGAGSKAVGFLSALADDDAVSAAVDVNPFKQGTYLPGSAHEILSPQSLQDLRPDLVVVMNPIYVPEITEMLSGLGLHPRVEALGATTG